MEASTGIEPVYTDLQSAASPLRQLALSPVVVEEGVADKIGLRKRGSYGQSGLGHTLRTIVAVANGVVARGIGLCQDFQKQTRRIGSVPWLITPNAA